MAAMRTMFERLGFTANAATLIVDTQGIDSLDELRLLKDSEVEGLCKVLRRPGGMVANNAVAIAAGGNAMINNPGTLVPLRAELNLKLTCYYLRHRVRISRVTAPGDITLPVVRRIIELRLTEAKHENPKDKPVIDAKDWPKTMEAIVEYFRAYLGETGIPLAYVIRGLQEVPAVEPPGGYSSAQDEMIARAAHLDALGNEIPTYLADRLKVWELISDIVRGDPSWSYVKPAQRTRNGRMAYHDLYDHYLGPNNVNNMASTAEKKLDVTTYDGEKRGWNFEKYVRVHVDQHTILTNLTQHGYAGLDEGSKVRKFLKGIKGTNLDSVKAQILATPGLNQDFAGCVTLYKDFMSQTDSQKTMDERNLSEVGISSVSVEDRYYNKKEYAALSSEQKEALRTKRKARGHQRGQLTPGTGSGAPPAKKQKRQIAKLQRQIAELTSVVDKGKAKDDDESDATPVSGNRNNPALDRQRGAGRG